MDENAYRVMIKFIQVVHQATYLICRIQSSCSSEYFTSSLQWHTGFESERSMYIMWCENNG
jgi:hypothetical protein